MKRDGKYRFSLQFGSETREQVQAGELLERLGNRKSAVVIAALNAYIAAHPELAEPAPVSVKIDGGIRRDALEQMIRSIIDERIANGQLLAGGVETPSIQMQEDLNGDIAAMISNLELFDGGLLRTYKTVNLLFCCFDEYKTTSKRKYALLRWIMDL